MSRISVSCLRLSEEVVHRVVTDEWVTLMEWMGNAESVISMNTKVSYSNASSYKKNVT